MTRSSFHKTIPLKLAVLVTILFTPFISCLQVDAGAQDIQLILETIDPEDFEDNDAFEAYIEGMLDLFPVDLNNASIEELLLVPGLTARLGEAIVAYREDRAFSKVEDLVNVPGIGSATVDRLRPWVNVHHLGNRRRSWSENFGAEQFFRFQQGFPAAAGYRGDNSTSRHYPGSPARLYHRQSVRTARISANLTQVKLPGEPFHSPAGFDFTSAHLIIHDTGPVNRLIAGDYAARFGQGLVIWSSPAFGKGGLAHSAPFRRSHGVTPYRSSGQIRYLRGIATELSLPIPNTFRSRDPKLTLSAFYSRRNRSAVEISGDTIRPPTVNPYHRTETELMRRHNTLETVQGGNISLILNRASMGFTWVSYGLNRPVVPNPGSSRYQGSDHRSAGTDFRIDAGPARFFGEYAWRISTSAKWSEYKKVSHGRRNAWIAGAMGSFMDGADWVLSVRSYQPGYWAEYAGGFGEGVGVPANQKGWYFGLRLRPAPRFVIQGFLDRFHFPQPRRGHTRPSSGWETMLSLQYRQRPGFHYQIRVRYKDRDIELETADDFLRTRRITGTSGRLTGRFQINWQLNKVFFIRSQYDSIRSSGTGSPEKAGFAISKALRIQPIHSLRIDLGWAFFDTDDFSSRLYLYEYDLINVMSSKMAHGTGRRTYAVFRYQPFQRVLIEAKVGYVHYSDRPVVGSGHDMTYGSSRSEAGLQLRFQY